MKNLNLITLALNDFYKKKIIFKLEGNVTSTHFWQIAKINNRYEVRAINDGPTRVLNEDAKCLEDIITAIEKDN